MRTSKCDVHDPLAMRFHSPSDSSLAAACRRAFGRTGDKAPVRCANEKAFVYKHLQNGTARRRVKLPEDARLRERQLESRHFAVFSANASQQRFNLNGRHVRAQPVKDIVSKCRLRDEP
jgi:hypothetical protein